MSYNDSHKEEFIAALKELFDFNPTVEAFDVGSWLTTNGNHKVAYRFFTVREDYSVTELTDTLAGLLKLRKRKGGGVIFYASEHPIEMLSKLLYDGEARKIRTVWR